MELEMKAVMEQARSVIWKEHQGKAYLSIDLRHLNRDGQINVLAAYVVALEGKPENSVPVLVQASDFQFHPDVITKARSSMMLQQGKVRRSALVNMDGILKIAFEGYYEVATMMGFVVTERGKHFKTEEEALAWLLQD